MRLYAFDFLDKIGLLFPGISTDLTPIPSHEFAGMGTPIIGAVEGLKLSRVI